MTTEVGDGAGRPAGTVVAITFPWGRYHATPWRRNVNEAAVDWPPAPWRLLRALYASWQWHCPDLPASAVEPLLGRLVAPPRYHLPPFTIAHTRHYLPGVKHQVGVSTDTDKTLDTFVVLERGARVLVEWPVSLTDDQRHVLGRLCRSVAYLGRAESITEVALLAVGEDLPVGGWIDEDEATAHAVAVLGADDPLDLDALVLLPQQVRAQRLRTPTGTRWLHYPEAVAARNEGTVRRRADRRPRPTAVRLAVTGAAPSPSTAALAIGDVLHKAVCKRLVTETLSGRSAGNERLTGLHQHAHYLPFSRDVQDRHLDSVLVWAPARFDEAEVQALAGRPIRLWAAKHVDGVSDRTLAVEAVGDVADVAPELAPRGGARVWRSVTPYVPVRHRGRRQTDEDLLIEDVGKELAYRQVPAATSVDLVRDGPSWTRFRRHRVDERLRQSRQGFGLTLVFDEPINGPLALGRFSHLGLGLFRPVPSPGRT